MDSTAADVFIVGLTVSHIYLATVWGRHFTIKQLLVAMTVCAVLCVLFIKLRKAFLELDRTRSVIPAR